MEIDKNLLFKLAGVQCQMVALANKLPDEDRNKFNELMDEQADLLKELIPLEE